MFLKKTIPDWILGEKVEYFDPVKGQRHWRGFGQIARIAEAPEKDPYVNHRYVKIEFLLDDNTPSGHFLDVDDDNLIRLSDLDDLKDDVITIANVLNIIDPINKYWKFASTDQFAELNKGDLIKFVYTNPPTTTPDGDPADWIPQAGQIYRVNYQNELEGWTSIETIDKSQSVDCIIVWDPDQERHWYE